MNLRLTSLLLLAPFLLSATPGAARAAESTDSCTGYITTLPVAISTPGTWCLKQNLSTAIATGNAILINANDVTIDCNDRRIDGQSAGAGTAARGIAGTNRVNSKVRNCTLRGFQNGVRFTGSGGGSHTVERNLVIGSTNVGIWLEGDGSVVRDNQVVDTGGSTLTAVAEGIHTRYSVDVMENTVSGVTGGDGAGNAFGISTSINAGGTIKGNRVRGVLKGGTGVVRGIYNTTAGRITLEDNDLVGDGSAGSVGVYCIGANARARNNILGGFATGLTGCGDAGGNDVGN